MLDFAHDLHEVLGAKVGKGGEIAERWLSPRINSKLWRMIQLTYVVGFVFGSGAIRLFGGGKFQEYSIPLCCMSYQLARLIMGDLGRRNMLTVFSCLLCSKRFFAAQACVIYPRFLLISCCGKQNIELIQPRNNHYSVVMRFFSLLI